MTGLAHIVVVDDEPEQLQTISSILASRGHRMNSFCCAADALNYLQAESVDLVLTDLRLPDIDGLDFVKQVKSVSEDIECVLMTGHSDVDQAVGAFRLGVADYLSKPFRLAELDAVVQRALYLRDLKESNQRLLESLERSNLQLREINTQLDSFAGRVAHDLNSMIALIQTYARALDNSIATDLDEQSRKFLSRIRSTSERCSALVSDLLAFARLGMKSLSVREVDLNAVLNRVKIFAELECSTRDIEWSIDCLPTVLADESLIEQVFSNLISNSVKYTRGVDHAKIELHYRVDRDFHCFSIIDNGVGFDPGRVGELFLPFNRLHDASLFEGNGLGLVNVKRIVEKHGGSVKAESPVDGGACFRFTLYRNLCQDSDDDPPQFFAVPDARMSEEGARRVLDDASLPVEFSLNKSSVVNQLLAHYVHKLNNAMLPFVLELDDHLEKLNDYSVLEQIKLKRFDEDSRIQMEILRRIRKLVSKNSLNDLD